MVVIGWMYPRWLVLLNKFHTVEKKRYFFLTGVSLSCSERRMREGDRALLTLNFDGA